MKAQALRAHSAQVIKIDIPGLRKARPVLPASIPASVITRIDALTDKSAGPNGVWHWQGSRNPANGYPQITFTNPVTGKSTNMSVHRVLMCIREGRMLGRSEFVLHDRGMPSDDVNPRHLRIGTHQENVDDALHDKPKRRRLTKAQVLEIVRLYQVERASKAAIAHRYGVNHRTVSRILNGQHHSALTGIEPSKGASGRQRRAA